MDNVRQILQTDTILDLLVYIKRNAGCTINELKSVIYFDSNMIESQLSVVLEYQLVLENESQYSINCDLLSRL